MSTYVRLACGFALALMLIGGPARAQDTAAAPSPAQPAQDATNSTVQQASREEIRKEIRELRRELRDLGEDRREMMQQLRAERRERIEERRRERAERRNLRRQ